MEYTFCKLLLASIGLTLIAIQGSIFSWLQNRHEFFRCGLCVGFWAGLAAGLIGYFTSTLDLASAACMGPATSLVAQLSANLVAALNRIAQEPLQPEYPSIELRPDSDSDLKR